MCTYGWLLLAVWPDASLSCASAQPTMRSGNFKQTPIMTTPDTDEDVLALRRSHPQVRFVDVLLADLCGINRGKRVTIDELQQVYAGGFALPGSIFALDVLGGTIQETGLGFDEGDADRSCVPIAQTLLPIPWHNEAAAQVQVSMRDHDGSPFFGDPRHRLAAVLERFTALRLTPVIAIELEFYFLDPQRTASGRVQPPVLPLSGRREHRTQINSMTDLDEYSAILAEISAACALQQIPSGTALAEYGPGQFEVNLQHSNNALRACDEAIRFKRLVRAIAIRHGMEATFMPKPYADMAGSGAHIHVSLLDEHGVNVFADHHPEGSPALRHAIGGLAATMSDAMLIFAATANSYRRYRSLSARRRRTGRHAPWDDAANRRRAAAAGQRVSGSHDATAAHLAGSRTGIRTQSIHSRLFRRGFPAAIRHDASRRTAELRIACLATRIRVVRTKLVTYRFIRTRFAGDVHPAQRLQ